ATPTTDVTRPPATPGPISRKAMRLYGGVGVAVGCGELDGIGEPAGTGGLDGFDSGERGGVCATAAAVPQRKTSAASAARDERDSVANPPGDGCGDPSSVRGRAASSFACAGLLRGFRLH